MKSNISAKLSIDIHAPQSKVWDALTKPELIKKYFFGTNTKTDWKPGHPITFEGEYEGKTYKDKGTVLAIEEGKKVKYNYWSSMSGIEDKPENYVDITYELHGENGNTRLEITQDNIPDEKSKEHSKENWLMVMNSLKKLLESN